MRHRSILLAVVMRFRFCKGYLGMMQGKIERHLFSSTDLDGLMEDILKRRVSLLVPNDESAGWRRIDWKALATTDGKQGESFVGPLTPSSPMEVINIGDRVVHMKRDDQVRLPGSQISGNKARKMLSLQQLDPSTFPACVVSHGGPQSNAMVAIAAVVRYQNERLGVSPDDPQRKRFVYFTKKLPKFLRKTPSGNLFRATSLGTEIVELSQAQYNEYFSSDSGGRETAPYNLLPPVPSDSVFIPQGGACTMAERGTSQLAREIFDYCSAGARRLLPWSICIPGGTCSTATLIQLALNVIQSALPEDEQLDIQVVVIPCVGDQSYARRQMLALTSQMTNSSSAIVESTVPDILPPSPLVLSRDDYFQFGEPNVEILNTFRKMQQEHDIVLDLLYGAPAWTILLRHLRVDHESGTDRCSMLDGRSIMYVHSGGMEGINTQLLRYKHKKLVKMDEIQLPKL